MIRVAVCDDDMATVEDISDRVVEAAFHKTEVEIHRFYSGEELIEFYKEGNRIDLLYLDIELKTGMNGVDTAKKIKRMDGNIILIFVSSHQQYWRELFEAEPFRFITKPIEDDYFVEVFRKACDRIIGKEGIFSFRKGYSEMHIPLKDIAYISSSKRIVAVHTQKQEFEFYGKLDDVINAIADIRFIRIHKSYIVNIEYISNYKYNEMTLLTGDILSISEDRRKEVRNIFIEVKGF